MIRFSRLFGMRWLCSALLLAVLTSCADVPASGATSKPRLLVFLVVDGLPQRQLTAYRDQLGPDGLARFLDHGVWYSQAYYEQSFTVTGAGHATMLSGAYSDRHGIVGNEWRDPQTGAVEYCAGDTRATYIGHTTKPLDGTSPKNIKVDMLGDVLKRLDPRSKVIAVSGKDRGAILLAGKSGTAYMYMGQSGQFASSTYYMPAHPAWVNQFNGQKLADAYFKTDWKPLLPEAAYARSLTDNQPWFGPQGGRLPMRMGQATDSVPSPAFYSQLLKSPFVDAMSLQFASAAVDGEGLGQDDATDILIVSLSGHDYVNHAYSAESRISHVHLLQLDRQLQNFFAQLDAKVGAGNYMAALTTDHGFMPAPEFSAQQGKSSGRIDSAQVLGRVNAGLQAKFGPGAWVSFSAAGLLINKNLLLATKAQADAVAELARTLLLKEEGIAAVYTRRELQSGSRANEPFFGAMQKSWHPQVSGDVQFIFKPDWMVGSSSSVTTHGSPYEYDTHVPILLYGPRWLKPARVDTRVGEADLAPTLAKLLGVPTPGSAQGKPMPLQNP
jgi:hypothetical protein